MADDQRMFMVSMRTAADRAEPVEGRIADTGGEVAVRAAADARHCGADEARARRPSRWASANSAADAVSSQRRPVRCRRRLIS